MRFGLYGSAPDVISIDLANSLLFTAFAVTWTGARVFDHRKPLPVLLFAAIVSTGTTVSHRVAKMPVLSAFS